jgi:hypothetical protein
MLGLQQNLWSFHNDSKDRSTDAGAPVSSGTVGSLIGLLDACLVNGYGTKAGAGLTIPMPPSPKVVGYEVMTDINTGTGQFPTSTQENVGCTYPNPVDGSMIISSVYLHEINVVRGIFPGLWFPCHARPLVTNDTLTGTGPLSQVRP